MKQIGFAVLVLAGVVALAQAQVDPSLSAAGGEGARIAGYDPVPVIPMEDFFRNPEKTYYQLSPDGQHVSFLRPWNDRLNIHVQPVGDTTATRLTAATERDIIGYFWANNERIVFVQDQAGDENYHLYAVSIDGSGVKELTPFESTKVRIVDDLEDVEDEMLISMNRRDPRVFDVYRIDINTGEIKTIAENPGDVSGWITDHDGRLRVATFTDGVNTGFRYRATEEDTFVEVARTDFKETLDPLFFTFDNQKLYVRSNLGRDKTAIYEYDPEEQELGELIFEHSEVDVAGLLRSRKRKRITGVHYVTDRRHYHFLDDWRAQLQADIDRLLPGYEAYLADLSRDESKALVRSYSDRSLGAYYYFVPETKELTKLTDVSPWIDERMLATMDPVSYRSRDSLLIHGYLTLPVGVEPRNLPAVMLVHGGPWSRDVWGFRSSVQFLVNRGYAVFQVNYRGSTGYGKSFWQAGFKQWGRAMQDDITDGVHWLVKQGIADPTRIGIYGASYGGYATLAGLAFTPDLYACGVDYVGVSNLFTFMNSFPPYWEPYREMQYEMVGDPVKDSVLLAQVSPALHADRIKAPLFIAQGANDPRVKKSEADQMVAALKERGIDVPYMVKENEGHGFANEENRFDFYRAMEEFLGRHLGGRVERRSEGEGMESGG